MTDTTPHDRPPDGPGNEATWLGDRAVIRIAGAEARDFLNGLLTQNVLTLQVDAPRWAGLLSPQGKALFDMILWADGPQDVLIDCEAASADTLVKRLSLYRLRRPVTIARDESLAVHWAPDAADKPADPRLAALGHRWLVAARQGQTDAASVWRAWRHGLGVAEGTAELGQDQTLWLEANARELNGVDFAKGCYVGQENTARMHYRQKVNRRLVVVPLALSDPARRRATFEEEGTAIDFRRTEDLAELPLPDWLRSALAAESPA